MPRLVNVDNNPKYLSDKPYNMVEDLAIIYVVRFTTGDSFSDAIINNDVIKNWSIELTELHKVAMDNMQAQTPCLMNMMSFLSGDHDSIDIDTFNPSQYELPIFILSNSEKLQGSVFALNSNYMDKLTHKLGEFYVVPSSVHEVLIIPKWLIRNTFDLKDTIGLVNSTDLKPADILSDHVYEYYSEIRSLSIVI